MCKKLDKRVRTLFTCRYKFGLFLSNDGHYADSIWNVILWSKPDSMSIKHMATFSNYWVVWVERHSSLLDHLAQISIMAAWLAGLAGKWTTWLITRLLYVISHLLSSLKSIWLDG